MAPKRRIKRRTSVNDVVTYLPHLGDLRAPLLIVLDPVVGSEGFRAPLNKRQMQWFVDHLKEYGEFKREDVCIVSCAPSVTHDTWGQGRLISAHLKEHRDELLRIINYGKPRLILPFGAKACQQIIGRAVQITKVRGQPFQEDDIANGIPVLPMLSPFYAQRQPENEAAFRADLQTASRIYKADYDIDASTIEYKHNYRWCTDLSFLLKKRPKRLSVDVEGVGLMGFHPETTMLTVQLCWKPGEVVVVPINYNLGKYKHHKDGFLPGGKPHTVKQRDKLVKQIKALMEDPRIEKIGQNFKFDWLMFWYQLDIEVQNYAHDTMLLAHLYDENQKRINIDDLVRQHVPEMAGFNDGYNNDPEHHGKSRMDLLSPDKMLAYAAGDADAAWRLLLVLLEKVKEDKGRKASLIDTYEKVTMPGMRAFCYIELNGFPVSKKELTAFEEKLRRIQKRERIYLMRQIPKSIKDKWKDSGVGLKPTRAAILRDWLYKHKDGLRLKPVLLTKTKEPSISSKQALPFYAADHPVIARLIEYIKNDKLLNTYAKGFHKYIYDNMIRPSYGLAGTTTGRSMSRDPNGQNFPKRGKLAKEYRRIFKAPPGWVFVSCDLSQAELRIAAMMSGDPNMLQVYASGGDIHRATAAGTMGLSVEEFLKLPKDVQDLKRFQAKAVNFGFLYGMWWVKFRHYAKTDYGIDFTEEEAKEIRQNFFRTYPMLEQWHSYVQEYVYEHGQIRTYDGRLRHLPQVRSPDESVAKQAQRQAVNSPVQSIASDLGIMTLGRLVPYIRKKGYDEWLKPCGFIHDAIICLVREDKVAHGTRIVKTFMENNPLEEWFDWTPEIPIIADAEIGRSLADTYELDAEQFESRKNKSYSDILHDIRDKLVEKLHKETDDKNCKRLESEIEKIEADIAQSDEIRSRPMKQYRKIKTKRSTNSNASRKTSKAPARSRVRLRKSGRNGKGSDKRRKPRQDKAA
jgi:DNA polymerase I-like protein with 3'-5' exonuclease and polymerase domains